MNNKEQKKRKLEARLLRIAFLATAVGCASIYFLDNDNEAPSLSNQERVTCRTGGLGLVAKCEK